MANTNPKYDHEEKLLDHSYDGIGLSNSWMPS